MMVVVVDISKGDFKMKKVISLLLVLCMFSFNVKAEVFMSAFEEIPLQEGLFEEAPFSFDTEEIRIIEQYVTSESVLKSEFVEFYTQTLKSLGWKQISSTDSSITFKREDESLVLDIKSEDPLVVQFLLKPFGK